MHRSERLRIYITHVLTATVQVPKEELSMHCAENVGMGDGIHIELDVTYLDMRKFDVF